MIRAMLSTTPIPGLTTAPTALVFGTGSLGSAIPADDAFRLMDRYAELGGNHFDSAHVYAAWLPRGTGASERTVGAWVRRRGMEGRVCVATKGAHFNLDGVHASRVRPECIAADLRESLDRLGLARVDLYYLHRDDPSVPVEPLLEALERERRAGLIGAYAASNWSAPRMAEARTIARARGWSGFVANQIEWSLAEVPPTESCGLGTRAA
ncbi:MAG: aldo/keto reductase, partial [Planctomycetota bacterium]